MFLAELRAQEAERQSYRDSIRRMIGDDSSDSSEDEEDEEEEAAGQAKGNENAKQEDDTPQAKTTGSTPALEDQAAAKEDPFERFKKMLKFGIPRVAVEDKMRKDGINPAGLDGPVPEGQVYVKPPPEPASPVPRPPMSYKKWHWAQEPTLLKESNWTERSEKGAAARISDASKAAIVRHFTSVIDPHSTSAARISMPSPDGHVSRILGAQARSRIVKRGGMRMMKGQKSLNFELAVRRITMPFAKVAEDLSDLTAVYIKVADIKTILSMWPSMAEQHVLQQLIADKATLGLNERFFAAIRAVPMVKEKLECLQFKLEFTSRVYELEQLAQRVTRALNQLHSSDKFKRIMWALRDFGNFVNGTEARSFSLESLLSLTTTKSFVDSTISLLDTFVEFIQRDYGDKNDKDNYLVEFYDEINQVPLCCNVSVSAMQAEMKQLREGHRLAVSLAGAASTTSASPEAAEETARSRTAFARFASEVDSDLGAVQKLLDELERSKQRFRSKYEENQDCPLEQNFNTIARFVSEFKARAVAFQRPVSRM